MYVVEAQSGTLHLVGNEATIEDAKDYIGTAALGALAAGAIPTKDAGSVMRELRGGKLRNAKRAGLIALENDEGYHRLLANRVMQNGALGTVSVRQCLAENAWLHE